MTYILYSSSSIFLLGFYLRAFLVSVSQGRFLLTQLITLLTYAEHIDQEEVMFRILYFNRLETALSFFLSSFQDDIPMLEYM